MSKVYTFWSANGGVGKTTLSTITAYNLAKRNRDKKVLLLDFNLVNPDIDYHLKISNVVDLKELLNYFTTNTLTENVLSSFFVTYNKQPNFQILSGLYDINYFDKFNIENFITIVELAKKMEYDYIIIDVDNSLNVDATFVGLVSADRLFIVTDPMYHSIRNINRYIEEALSKININDDNLYIIVNKFKSKYADKEEVKRLLGRDDLFFVNYTELIPICTNKGIPFVDCKEREARKLIDQINDISDLITRLSILIEGGI